MDYYMYTPEKISMRLIKCWWVIYFIIIICITSFPDIKFDTSADVEYYLHFQSTAEKCNVIHLMFIYVISMSLC